MNKNLTPKVILIIILIVLAVWTLYPPSKTLKQGIDLKGGTSLIYEIDTFGLTEAEKKGLAQKMITVLRRRIDPFNIQELKWIPQGNTRFEIKMPLASENAIEKRRIFQEAKDELLDKNISRTDIIQALQKSEEERNAIFSKYAQNDPNKLKILEDLAGIYDERQELESNRASFKTELENIENTLSSSGFDPNQIINNVDDLKELKGQKLRTSLAKITDANDNIEQLTKYVETYANWSNAVDRLSEIREQYVIEINRIDRLNLTEDMLNLCLDNKPKKRKDEIQKLKTNFPDRANEIDKVIAAYDQYSPEKGRLDDPQQLKRMLKGAGKLEFRILPTWEHPDVDTVAMNNYLNNLQTLGPTEASQDNQYIWIEIEDANEWRCADAQGHPAVVGEFGGKTYVLASDRPDDVMLRGSDSIDWKLEKAYSTWDQNKRAIGFFTNKKGERLMGDVTGNNIGRPLCIILDDKAISAPNIDERIPGQGRITGNFTKTEVDDMVHKLNAGSLPARLIEQPISENTIGPSIGADNRDQGIKAGIIGLIAVIACMAIYYCLAGAIADVALLLNILFVLAIMAGINARFSLAGIAGIILTIGMSVDANVLIFERIREEQQRGSSLRIAITNGYQKAFRTIFDANLTTFITAAILFWRASEEVKGFAIVLMLGIASSMFTALFVTRVVLDFLVSRRIIKDHLLMLRLIHNPKVNWMRLRPVFFFISILLIAGGVIVFFIRTRYDVKNNIYDIEFTGGTSVQIVLAEGVELTRQQVEDRIREKLPAANVYSIGKTGNQFEITTTETNKIIVTANLPQTSSMSVQQMTDAINKVQEQETGLLSNLLVTQDADNSGKFVISTSQMNQSLVKKVLEKALPKNTEISEPQVDEVVNDAIRTTFADELKIQQDLQPNIVSEEVITSEMVAAHPVLSNFKETNIKDGIKIDCEIQKPTTIKEIEQRFKDLQIKSELYDFRQSTYKILSPLLSENIDVNQPVNSFVYVSIPRENIRNTKEQEKEWTNFVNNEKAKILAATEFETSLPRVRQFDPLVGSEQKTRAMIAILLSLFAIVTYIWIRFGNVRYGVAAIIALIHDVCITFGAVTACTYIASTPIGEKLFIGDFKIDLAIIAAFLTLIGYSLNDTIVVFDRIRENRGKAQQLNPQTITDSINQTISRTILTSFTTFIVVFIMYIFGGPGLRGFNFAIGFGIIVGTYSSIAIAAPILLIGTKIQQNKNK
ncbi:MAG: protein translocase subunit SecD [Sedimentisphaerales bacterium]|nr:protein translocase subunit SecD [Sedimentisphaerales bacterium]